MQSDGRGPKYKGGIKAMRKIRTRAFSILLTCAMLLSLLPATALAINVETRDTMGYKGEKLPAGPDTSSGIWTVTPANAQYTLDGAYGSISGKTICFSSGEYEDVLVLGRANKFSGSDTKYYSSNWTTTVAYDSLQDSGVYRYSRTVENVTFTAEAGVVLPGFTASSGHKYGTEDNPAYDYVRETSTESTVNSYYAATILKNLTFDGLTFSGSVIINDYLEQADTDGITFTGCTFRGDAAQMATNGFCGIGMKADTKQFKNVTVKNCSFTNYFQGIYVQGPQNWTIRNCTFDGTTHNAIALQSSGENPVTGTITLEENVIKGAKDRAVRLGDATDAAIVLENNIMLRSGDDAGQLIKAGNLNRTTVSLNYNYWGGAEVSTAVDGGLTQPTATGIHGGSFGMKILPAYCAAGFVPEDLGDGTYGVKADTSFFQSGSGTQADPYIIMTASQLAAFRDSVNSGNSYDGQYIRLDDNITLDSSSWEPIGTGTRSGSGYTGNAFKGTFDGNGRTISGLTIAANATGKVDTAYGLFGVVAGGTVKDLTLTGVDIDVTNGECVGGFIGLMVEDSTASGLVMGSKNGGDTISAVRGLGGIVGRMTISGTIANCVNYAAVNGSGANVGGIVGAAYYTADGSAMSITNCKNHGTITCTAGVVGGIAGLSAADVEGCENTAAITGNGADVAGIVAEQQNAGSVTGCVNSGEITNQSEAYGTGGIVGWVRYNGAVASYPRKEIIEVTNNVNSGAIHGGNDGGGIVGTVYNAAVVTGNENTAPSISGKAFAAGIVGNLQFTETPVGGTIATHAVTICHNISSTPLDQISGPCKDLYVYNNDTAGTAGITIGDNGTAFEAQIGTQKYTSLDAALLAVETSGGEITLLRDATLADAQYFFGGPTTIYGNGFTVDVTVKKGAGNTQAFILTDRSWALQSGSLTLDNVKMAIRKAEDDTGGGLRIGFDVTQSGGSHLTLQNGTEVTMEGLDRAFTTGTSLATITIDNSTVIAKDISGNGSNGGTWEIKNGSSVSFADCGYHALSTDVLKVSDSQVTVDGAAWLAIYASSMELNNAQVTVTNSATSGALAGNSYANKGAVQLKGEQSLMLTNSTLILSGNGNNSEEGKQSIYVGGGTVSSINSTIKGDILTDPPAQGSFVVTCVSDGQTVAVATVADGKYTLPVAPTKDGYTFAGWSDGSKTYGAGKEAAIGKDTTFTARWSELPQEDGSSSGSATGDYLVNVGRATGGKVTVNPGRADKGDTVTITVKPDDGYVLDELAVTAKEGGSVKLTWKDDNKYTFTMPGSQVTVEATFVKEGGQVVTTLPFTDVTTSDWYYDAVEYVYENDLMNGTSATAFSPFMTTSRAMILTILARYDGVDTSTGSTWYEAGAVWAIAEGVSDGTNLEANLTREQLVTMLWRYAGSPVVEGDLADYPDSASVSDWAVNAMIWAVDSGVITGNGAGALNPQGTATRAEVATILMRFIEN